MSIDLVEFSALALAHFIALLSPGPDFILILGSALQQGARRTTWACLGIALANGFYILLAIGGFTLMRENPVVFWIMKVLAAAYLLYLGVLLIRSAPQASICTTGKGHTNNTSRRQMFLRGTLSALLNPHNIIFYLSLMALIVSQTTPVAHQLLYGLWMFSIVLAWDLLIAWSIGNPRMQRVLNQHSWKLERLCGGLLMSMGIWVFFQ